MHYVSGLPAVFIAMIVITTKMFYGEISLTYFMFLSTISMLSVIVSLIFYNDMT